MVVLRPTRSLPCRTLDAFVICYSPSFFTASLLFAQADRGVITGLVTDAQGAAVASATVQIKDTNTGVVTTVRTSSNGAYSTPPLVIGTYEVSVSLQGFKAFHASGISLAAGQTFGQDVSLQLGDV